MEPRSRTGALWVWVDEPLERGSKGAVSLDGALEMLSGTTHIVITGVAVQRRATSLSRNGRVMSSVRMKRLTPQEVAQNLQTLLSGFTVTQYREGIEHIDVVARAVADDGAILGVVGLALVVGAHRVAHALGSEVRHAAIEQGGDAG